jgi:hypothetical protein
VVLFLPFIVAVAFSLPHPDLGAYFGNGLVAVIGSAIVAGIYGSGVESPTACELLYAEFDGYFLVWSIVGAVSLGLGLIPFGALLFLFRRLNPVAT